MSQNILRDTRIIIDLNKISHNMDLITKAAGDNVAIMAVIKANAYGHGAKEISPVLMEHNPAYLAVATLSEAIEIRSAYSDYPIFILGHTPDDLLEYIVTNNITQTIFSYNQAKIISDIATKLNKTAKIHIKVDTGFHRLGKTPSPEYLNEIVKMFSLPMLEIEGIFSHLALAGRDDNEKQFLAFTNFVNNLESAGCHFKYVHIADSIASIDYPEYRLNMIRPGSLLYGMKSFEINDLPVEQALSFKTAISDIHEIKNGEGISYDYDWRATRDSRIATLPVGYADGFPRQMSNKGYVIIEGQKAPVIGIACMDQCTVDITNIPEATESSIAILYSDGKDGAMTIQDAASLLGTNKNDILCRLTARPPRVYI